LLFYTANCKQTNADERKDKAMFFDKSLGHWVDESLNEGEWMHAHGCYSPACLPSRHSQLTGDMGEQGVVYQTAIEAQQGYRVEMPDSAVVIQFAQMMQEVRCG
jgi:hypothetical protein